MLASDRYPTSCILVQTAFKAPAFDPKRTSNYRCREAALQQNQPPNCQDYGGCEKLLMTQIVYKAVADVTNK
jgi:hypothetical protein